MHECVHEIIGLNIETRIEIKVEIRCPYTKYHVEYGNGFRLKFQLGAFSISLVDFDFCVNLNI